MSTVLTAVQPVAGKKKNIETLEINVPDICLLLIGIFGIFLLKNKEKEKTYLNVCVAEQSAYLSRHNLIGRHVTGPFAHVAPLAAVQFARKSLLIDGSSAFDCPLILDK